MDAAISSPRAPARRRANGSRKSPSGRSVSRARYTAAHRAVSEMFRIRSSRSLTFLLCGRSLRGNVLDLRGDIPLIAERILYASDAITVGLLRRLPDGSASRLNRALINRVHIGDAEIEHGRHRLIVAVGFAHFEPAVADLHPRVLHHPIGRRVPREFHRAKCAFQEADYGLRPEGMQIGLHRGSVLGLVRLSLGGGNIPVVPERIL